MRSITKILITIIMLSVFATANAQNKRYYIYDTLRNHYEAKISQQLLLSNTIASPQTIKKVMKQCYDSAMVDTDYRKVIGSLAHICEFYQKINDTLLQNQIIEKIDSIGNKHNDQNALIEVFLLKELGYQISGDLDKSIEMLTKAALLAEKINNKNAQAQILQLLSILYANNNDKYNCTRNLLDALKTAEESRNPITIADIYLTAAEYSLNTDELQMATAYITAAAKVYKTKGNTEKLGKTYITTGYLYLARNNYDTALYYFCKAIKLLQPTQNKLFIAKAYNGAAYIGQKTNHYQFAENCYINSLKIRQSLGLETEMIESLSLYAEFLLQTNGNNDTIINYLTKAYSLAEKYKRTWQMTRILRHMARAYAKKNDYKNAYQNCTKIIQLQRGQKLQQQDPDKLRAVLEYNFDIDKEYATEMIRKSANETIKKRDNEILILSIAIALIISQLTILIIANFKRKKQNEKLIDQKKQIEQKTLELQKKNVELDRISSVAKYTSNGIAIINNNLEIEWLNQSIINQLGGNLYINDYIGKPISIYINARGERHLKRCLDSNKSISFETKWYNNEYFQITLTPYTNRIGRKQIIANTTNITQQKKVEEEIEKKKRELELQTQMMIVINSELSAQKEAVLEQNEKLEAINNEINESLEYARKIQDAIQPLPIFLEAILNEFFVINFPKNIVSGDFHCFDYHNGNTYIALADCTGHGIPGAFMSMLGTVTLSNIIATLTEPNAANVLNILRQKIIKILHQRGKIGEAQDGMDISLCIYNNDTHVLHFSGAYSYTYIGRCGYLDQETIDIVTAKEGHIIEDKKENTYLICLKPDHMPIGIHNKDHIPFTDLELKVKCGDILYMSSDGFSDQFGGPKNKKYYSSNFEKLLLSVLKLNLEQQKKVISDTFINWKGFNEQVDDVHIIGIRL